LASVRITGLDDLHRALRQAGPLALTALTAAAVQEQEQVITDAKTRTPVDTGTLRGSGTVLPPKVSGTQVEVTAGFGGAASDYAIYVHEDLTKNHPVGGAKFLEGAFLERVPGMPKRMARTVEQAWRRLGG
jgi:hypothetical protein